MYTYFRTAVILTAALTVISCDAGSFLEPGLDDGEPTRLEVASLVLDSLPAMVAEGDTVHLRVTALDPDGEPIEESIEVQWSSTDETVATFESTSTTEADLVAEQPGTTTITASYDGTSTSTTVEVHKRPVDVVYVAGSGQQAAPGDTLTDSLTVRVVDKRGDAVSGVYLDFVVVTGGGTASPASGTTDNAGHLSAAWTLGEAGDQVVEARVSEAQARVKKVQDSVVVFTAQLAETTTQTVTASSVTIDPDSATMEEDTVVDLDAVVQDSDGNTIDRASVTWSSSDTTVATVDTTGLVTPVAAGQITISATADGVTGEAAVTVEDTASGTLTITSADTTLDGVGDTLTLTVEARDADGNLISDPDLQWNSDDTTIATVDTMGLVTARAIGTAVIAVSAACCSGDFGTVSVVDALTASTAFAAPGDGQVTVSADEPTGGTTPYTYQWYRDTVSGFTPGAQSELDGFTSLSETDTGLTNGTTYYYVLVATDEVGTQAAYDQVSATPDTVVREVLFHSDWGTATGTSDAAIHDTNKAKPWDADGTLNGGDALTVIQSTGLDFPTTNVLQVDAVWRSGDAGAYAANLRINGLGVPAVGESLFYRWYIRVTIPDSYDVDTDTHPIQDGTSGSITNWQFVMETNTDGTYTVHFNMSGGGQNDWPNNNWGLAETAYNSDLIPLNKDQTYRFEVQIKRTGTSTIELHARVYNSSDTLLYDDNDFYNVDGSSSLADNVPLNLNDVNYLDLFQIGHNGFTGGVESDYGFVISYQGGVAVCANDWCGQY